MTLANEQVGTQAADGTPQDQYLYLNEMSEGSTGYKALFIPPLNVPRILSDILCLYFLPESNGERIYSYVGTKYSFDWMSTCKHQVNVHGLGSFTTL
jgi:hypothetical protein